MQYFFRELFTCTLELHWLDFSSFLVSFLKQKAKVWKKWKCCFQNQVLYSWIESLVIKIIIPRKCVCVMYVTDGSDRTSSVPSSVLCLRVDKKGQGLWSGILVIFNHVQPVQWMWKQELKLFYSCFLNYLTGKHGHKILWNGCHHP